MRWLAAAVVLLVALVGVLLMRGFPRQPRSRPAASASSPAVQSTHLSTSPATASAAIEPPPPPAEPLVTTTEDADPLATARIVGTVSTQDGRAVDALVALLPTLVRGRPHHRFAKTHGGSYEFRVRPGEWEVRAEAEAGISAHGHATVAEGETVRVDLVLLPYRYLVGLVTDPDGHPVPGAVVTPIANGFLRPAIAGPDGRYRLAVLEPRYPLRAEARGWGPGTAEPKDTGAEEVLCDLHLTRPASIAGRVRTRDGSPMPGVLVRALPTGWAVEAFETTTTSDARGEFVIEWLDPGKHQVQCRADGYLQLEAHEVTAGSVAVDLVMTRVSHVRGGVVMRGTGAPVPRAKVSWDWARTTTSEAGEFDLAIGPTPSAIIAVEADGLAPGASRPIALRPEQDVDGVVIELSAGGSIEGLVVGVHSGRGVPDAKVHLSDDGREATTDAEGRFLFEHVATGPHWVSVSDGSGASTSEEVQVAEGGSSHAALRLPAGGGRIFGTITDATGPLPKMLTVFHGTRRGVFDPDDVRAARDGTYEVKRIEEGDYLVSFGPGFLDKWAVERRVHVGPGESVRLDVQFPRGARVRGVAHARGRPCARREFRIEGADFWAVARTDADGRYVIERVPPGAYRPTDASSSAPFEIPEGASEVTWDINFPE